MRSPSITHECPSTGIISYWIGRLILAIMGWKIEGELPPGRKFVLIGAPHTSNWDFVVGIAVTYVLRVRVHWIGKHTLFRWPYGAFMHWLGGIGVDRTHPAGVVEQLADQLRRAERMVLLITPDGTRSKRECWKSGFYRIALAAKVPLLCGSVDFSSKTARIGLCFEPTGDVAADMQRIREFYAGVSGAYPEKSSPVRLREELT